MLAFSSKISSLEFETQIVVQCGATEDRSLLQKLSSSHAAKVLICDNHLDAKVIQRLTDAIDPLACFFVDCSEEKKSRQTLFDLQDQLISNNIRKDALMICFGGGMLSDLVTLLAATYLGGIDLCIIPTTLLAMVDASLGGKGAVNACGLKNRIGVFYPAKIVIIDPQLTLTQDAHNYLSGMAEVIKYGLIQESPLFDFVCREKNALEKRDSSVLQTVIESCSKHKMKICQSDPLDKGIRRILNFGHTVAHGLEALVDFSIPHGEAVAFGMVIETILSWQKGLMAQSCKDRILFSLLRFGFGLEKYTHIDVEALFTLCCKDKKNPCHIPHFIALEGIGKVSTTSGSFLTPMSQNELCAAIEYFQMIMETEHAITPC